MPRVSAEHEQAVRARIVEAAIKVFGTMGYDRASIQDVVRESGLSVGAVYTHFQGKDELFLVACACEAERETNRLESRLSELGALPDRLRVAVDWAIDEAMAGTTAKSALAHAWVRADTSPELREMLAERRSQQIRFTSQILTDAIAAGELPAWIDAESIAGAFITMINGFVIQAGELGMDGLEARRQAYAILELLLAAPTRIPGGVDGLRVAIAQH
jgi:AcrR family transcriptional regulator